MFESYTEDWRRTLENCKTWLLDYEQFMGWASGEDAVKYLGQAKSRLEKVLAAIQILKDRLVEFEFDGELQLDAAVIPEIGERKAPGSPVAGHANVLIFPDLDAGNIGYKLTERFAGATALGPLLQGLARPMMDLSRGCTAEDIELVAACAMLLGG